MDIIKKLQPYLLLIIVCFVIYLPGLTSLPIIDRDEPLYTQATRQMLQTHNFSSIHFQHITRFQKPPGINWLQAISVATFSNAASTKVWPYRLPSILGAILAILLVFGITKQRFGTNTAWLSAILLSGSFLLNIVAHLATIDACLLATVVLMQISLWQIYAHARQQGNAPNYLPPLFWLAMSAGFALKGVTPLVGLLTIVALCIVDRNISWLKHLRFSLGLILFLLSSFWLLLIDSSTHSFYLWEMFRKDLLPKLASYQKIHHAPFGTYILTISVAFWPSSLFILLAARWGWLKRRAIDERFLLAWIIPTWFFFELMPIKSPVYIIPIYPALAILTARALANLDWQKLSSIWRKVQWLQFIFWSLIGTSFAAVPILISYFIQHQIFFSSIVAAGILLAGVLTCLILIIRHRWLTATILSTITSVIGFSIMLAYVLPNLHNFWLSQKIVSAIKQHVPYTITEKKPLYVVGYKEPSLVFLLGTDTVNRVNPEQLLTATKKQKQILLLACQPKLTALIPQIKNNNIQIKSLANIAGPPYTFGHCHKLKLLHLSYQPNQSS